MKRAMINCEMKNTMSNFKAAYDALLVAIDHYELTHDASVNDLPGFVEDYPFDKSFDELAIAQWVDSVVSRDPQHNFRVLDYQYLNTGGNTMVGIHEVWLLDEKRTVFVYTNEEGCTIAIADYIRKEIDADDYDELILDSCDFGRLTGYETYFELYRYCLNEYTKSDCSHFGSSRGISYHLLSDELQNQVSEEYLEWLESDYDGLVETDGYVILVNPLYELSMDAKDLKAWQDDVGCSHPNDYDKWLEDVEEFRRWHTTTAGEEEYYDKCYKLEFAGHKIELPFMADIWDAVDMMLERTIRDW